MTTCLEHTKKNSLCLSFQIEWGLRKAFPFPLSPYPTEKSVPAVRVWYGDRESEGEEWRKGEEWRGEADSEMLTLGWGTFERHIQQPSVLSQAKPNLHEGFSQYPGLSHYP